MVEDPVVTIRASAAAVQIRNRGFDVRFMVSSLDSEGDGMNVSCAWPEANTVPEHQVHDSPPDTRRSFTIHYLTLGGAFRSGKHLRSGTNGIHDSLPDTSVVS